MNMHTNKRATWNITGVRVYITKCVFIQPSYHIRYETGLSNYPFNAPKTRSIIAAITNVYTLTTSHHYVHY